MPAFPPLYAKGKALTKTITAQVINSGDTSVTVNNVSSLVPGQHVFTSDAGGTANVEYLGKIKSINTLTIVTQFRARFARVNGASLWIPAASWQATTVLSLGAQNRSLDPGIEMLKTTGSQDLRTRTRDAREYKEMTWSNARRSDLVAYQAWMVANTGNCLGTWTVAWFDSELAYVRSCKVQLMDADREQTSKDENYALRSWARRMQVIAVDAYL